MADRRKSQAPLLLLQLLKEPSSASKLTLEEWTLLFRLTRAVKLTAHIGARLERLKLLHTLPERVIEQFEAAKVMAEFRRRMALWELNRIARALRETEVELIVLKGGAYMLTHLPIADGRLVSDVDLLVAKDSLRQVEQTLLSHQWKAAPLNEYDQHYYREWMHEIPPLRHRQRQFEVDIHHTIAPLTSRLHPDPALLIKNATPAGEDGFKVLAPVDMVLHSAVHLFYDSDLSLKLRDLVDLDQLLRHFCQLDSHFCSQLVARSVELQLQRPLYYTLRYTHQMLDTPIADEVWPQLQPTAPALPIRIAMDLLVPCALLPEHPDHRSRTVAAARWLLYVRSHYLRMPLTLLLPHLLRKSRFGKHPDPSPAG